MSLKPPAIVALQARVSNFVTLITYHEVFSDRVIVSAIDKAMKTAQKGMNRVQYAAENPGLDAIKDAGFDMADFRDAKEMVARITEQTEDFRQFEKDKVRVAEGIKGTDFLKAKGNAATQYVKDQEKALVRMCRDYCIELFDILKDIDKKKANALKEDGDILKRYLDHDESDLQFIYAVNLWCSVHDATVDEMIARQT